MNDDTYVYDKAEYHMTGLKGGAPSWERACGCPLFMLRWLIEHQLVSPFFLKESEHSLTQYRSGKISLFQLYESDWDMVLSEDMLTEEGNAFARIYFDYDNGYYLQDLLGTLASPNYEPYPLFSEEAYIPVAPVIDSRFAEWKAGTLRPVVRTHNVTIWQFRIWQFVGVLIAICAIIWLFHTFFHPR